MNKPTLHSKADARIEVNFIEHGKYMYMSRRMFNLKFGKDEGLEMLKGHHSSIVAIIL